MGFLSLFLATLSLAQLPSKIEKFEGRAERKGKIVYIEKHEAQFAADGKPLKAKTEYFDINNNLMATLSSDFTKSLTAPQHEFIDLRFQSRHGIRYTDQGLEMFTQEGTEKEQTKVLTNVDDGKKLLVGCQGLGYYFRDHVQKFKEAKKTPILFLIPGVLDTYNFELEYEKPLSSNLDLFEIHVKNFFLRLFAPTLEVFYDANLKRMTKYKGVSNLYDEKKKQQIVEINYTFE
jgi:hypothetical protein